MDQAQNGIIIFIRINCRDFPDFFLNLRKYIQNNNGSKPASQKFKLQKPENGYLSPAWICEEKKSKIMYANSTQKYNSQKY